MKCSSFCRLAMAVQQMSSAANKRQGVPVPGSLTGASCLCYHSSYVVLQLILMCFKARFSSPASLSRSLWVCVHVLYVCVFVTQEEESNKACGG